MLGFSLRLTFAALTAGVVACAPSLDWREMSPAGSGLTLRIPCKPSQQARPANASGPAMGMAVCEAGGFSFSAAWADLDSPERLGPALAEMPRTVAAKLGQPLPQREPVSVPGATPLPGSGAFRIAQGSGATRVAVFAKGLRVYQLTLQGVQDDTEVWRTFVEGLRIAP